MVAYHLDFETTSAANLKTAGVYRYAEHDTTRVVLFAYQRNDEGVHLFHPGRDAIPDDLLDHIRAGGIVKAHNSSFERIIWNRVLRRQFPDWPELAVEQMDCTMARACALGLPADLDGAAEALGMMLRKDDAGHRLMLQMSRPRSAKANDLGIIRYHWWDYEDPEKLKRLGDYCMQDVRVETELDRRLAPLNEGEHVVWLHDQHLNDRGVQLDVPLIERLLRIVGYARKLLDARMAEVTGNVVTTCNQVTKLKPWLEAWGIVVDSLDKEHLNALLERADLEPRVREALRLRKQGSKNSTAKYEKMLDCVCADGRARGLLFYHGAISGRWSGRLIQPQNLYRIDPEKDDAGIHAAIGIAQSPHFSIEDAHDAIATIVDDPMLALAKTMRSMFIAAPGHHYVGGDLKNIEGRLNAWFADETWKLDAFRAFDANLGPDLYNIAYSRAFGIPIEQVDKPKRQIGKVQELACGYQGAVGAYINMGKNYGLKPAHMVRPVQAAVEQTAWEAMLATYRSARDKHGLPPDQWTAIKLTVQSWRKANSRIVASWWELQDAVVQALCSPEEVVPVLDAKVKYLYTRGYLWCVLPSGRPIGYLRPMLKEERRVTAVDQETGDEVQEDDFFPHEWQEGVASGRFIDVRERFRRYVDYQGRTDEGFKARIALFGGLLCNHVVQGTARDVLWFCIKNAEESGYPLTLHTHDELLTEPPLGVGSAEELERIMSTVPWWLEGLPLAASGWAGGRYEK